MDFLNSIAWWELVGRDRSGAQRVHTTLGWHVRELGLRQRYPLWTMAGKGRAGWAALPEEALAAGGLPHWMPCVPVQNLQKGLALAEQLAGQVVLPPTWVPHLGLLGTLVDPQGAGLTLLEPTAAMRRWLWRAPVPVLTALDPLALAPFYEQLLGWRLQRAEKGKLFMELAGERVLELAQRETGAPPLWLPRWPQPDSQAALDRWEFCGGKRIQGLLVDAEGVASLPWDAEVPRN